MILTNYKKAWLQFSYCLSIATLLEGYIGSFEPSPESALLLLKKLDVAFASLVTGTNAETGTQLPGFGPGLRPVSMTEKIRIKSIADATRIVAAKYLGDESDEEEFPGLVGITGLSRTHERIGRVYDKTITALGTQLGDNLIGLVSDN